MATPYQVLTEARDHIRLQTGRFHRIPSPLHERDPKPSTSVRRYRIKSWEEKRAKKAKEVNNQRAIYQANWLKEKSLYLSDGLHFASIELIWRPGHQTLLPPMAVDSGLPVATLNGRVRFAEIPQVSTVRILHDIELKH